MSLLRLDYQRDSQALPPAGLAVLGLALLFLVAIGIQFRLLQESTGQLESRLKALPPGAAEVARQEGLRGEKASAALAGEIRQANLVLYQLSVPWDALFDAVEAASDKEVTLLSMAPDVDKQLARINGEARNMAAVLNYLRQLGKQPVLHDINLEHHQVQQQDSEKPIRFTIVASWELKS